MGEMTSSGLIESRQTVGRVLPGWSMGAEGKRGSWDEHGTVFIITAGMQVLSILSRWNYCTVIQQPASSQVWFLARKMVAVTEMLLRKGAPRVYYGRRGCK